MAPMTEITPELVLRAYASGLFPMAPDRESNRLDWYSPEERGILPLDGMHVSRSLMKTVKSGKFSVTSDQAYDAVVRGCAASMPGREETWISERIRVLYGVLYERGVAHSVEVWREGRLVGGLYGLAIGGACFGESMFSLERDASKVALVHLVAALRSARFRLLDTQYTTQHLTGLGGIGIPADVYRTLLSQALTVRALWPGDFSFSALRESILALR